MIWRWWEPWNRAFCPSMLASQKLQIKSNHHISMGWSSMRTWVVRKSVKIEGVSSNGSSSTQMNSPTEAQPVWEDEVMMMTMMVMVVMMMVMIVIIMMSMRRASNLRMHVNPISSHADYSDATQMQRVWDFACFLARKGTWITADKDQKSQIFVQLKPIPSTGITSAEQSQFCTILQISYCKSLSWKEVNSQNWALSTQQRKGTIMQKSKLKRGK